MNDDEEEREQVLNPWIGLEDKADDSDEELLATDDGRKRVFAPILSPATSPPVSGSGSLTGSLLPTQIRKRQQFLGGVDDDDERMLQFVNDLELDIEIVKRETLIREATMPVIDEPWGGGRKENRAVAECRFHKWGDAEAAEYYKRVIAPLVDTRERVWYAYRAEIVDPVTKNVQAWFIGATNYLQDDITRILVRMITGKTSRRINDGEKTPEFNRYTLLQQVGYSCYRKWGTLEFFRIRILPEESKLLNSTRSFSTIDQLQIETQAIGKHNGWFINEVVAQGRCGLNYWDPLAGKLFMKWGISLLHLRDILDEDDFRCKNWTINEVFERTMKPRAGSQSYVEFLKRSQPIHINEDVDWFLSPSCYNCIWWKVVFNGGISLYAQDPKPIVRGNRYVFAELFLR